MSDLSKALTLRNNGGSSLQKAPPPQRPNIAALQKAVAQRAPVPEKRNKGICFVIDATASRSGSWREAQNIQGKMFDALKAHSDAAIGIICHRGSKVEHLGWFTDAASAKRSMAEIECIGGNTRVVPSLRKALSGNDGKPPSSVILVGDCFEEDERDMKEAAAQLKAGGVKVYAFLEGDDPTAANAFRTVAEITGGIFKKFGESMDLNLGDLAVAAAVYDTGGRAALQQLAATGNKGAKELLLLAPGGSAQLPPPAKPKP